MAAGPRPRRTPKLQCHKTSGRAYVELNGRRVYLGPWGTTETDEAYHRTLAEWAANGYRLPIPPPDVLVSDVLEAYLPFAKREYPKGRTFHTIVNALTPVLHLYGDIKASKFSPLSLKAVRQHWIDGDHVKFYRMRSRPPARIDSLGPLSVKTVNDYTKAVRRMFKWAVSEGMVDPEIYGALLTVPLLRRGRGEARDTDPVKPVPQEHIEAVRSTVSRQVRALIDLQLLTGARPGELIQLRRSILDMTGDVWVATPRHKTEHLGRVRYVPFGPKAQALLQEFLLRPADSYCFDPREAFVETMRAMGKGTVQPDERIGERYTVASYRRAIHRACERAGIPKWGPGRLRHNSATAYRRAFGIEVASNLLGHAVVTTTEIYAERDLEKAKAAVREIG